MSSERIQQTLERIAAVSSTKAKEEILREALGGPDQRLMERILVAAYDPYVTYGVTAPTIGNRGEFVFHHNEQEPWDLLSELATRQLTGNLAIQTIQSFYAHHEIRSCMLLANILNKDLRCGITAKTINKVRPGLIPSFEVMLAHKFDEKRVKSWPVVVEPKLDGVRVICVIKDDTAEFFSRTGKPFPAVDHLKPIMVQMLASAAAYLADNSTITMYNADRDGLLGALCDRSFGTDRAVVLDGEIVAGSFNETSGSVRRKNEAAVNAAYHVFDAISAHEFVSGEFITPYTDRRKLVEILVTKSSNRDAVKASPRYFANSVGEIQQLYEAFRADKLEGAIVKPPAGFYEAKRSYNWMKMKAEETADLVVTGKFEGTGKYEGKLGGLIVDHNGVEVRVGGGFSDAQRDEFWRDFEAVDGRMIEVEYHEITPDGSLRHPRFVRFRDDKYERNSSNDA